MALIGGPRPVVVGIGEVLWDVFPDGERLGGAPANFACHASALGADAWLVSAVGQDDLGDRALDQLRAHGVITECVARVPEHSTGRVIVTLDDSKVPSYEITRDVAWDHIPWSTDLEALAHRADAVCFGTLGQRSSRSRETITRFLHATRDAALRILDLNLRQNYFDVSTVEQSLELASALKLNENELTVLAALCGTDSRGTPATLKAIARRYDLRLVALTRGPDGAVLVAGDQESTELPPPVRVVDTVGAGDAFTASMVCDFLRGSSLGLVNRHANEIAAFVCSLAGATGDLSSGFSEYPIKPRTTSGARAD